MTAPPLVQIKEMSVSYPQRTVLERLNIDLMPETSYALLGPSGCGKTTLIYALAGILPKASTLTGEIINRACSPSTVLQDFGLFPWKTVLENVLLPLALKNSPGTEDESRSLDILETFGLTAHRDDFPASLSGGQKQRVALARALVVRTDLLLLDEPFSSLDALTRETLQDDLRNALARMRATSLLVTHSIEEAVYLGRKILLMDTAGRIIQVFDNPSHSSFSTRKDPAFHEACIAVRKCFEEVYDETSSLAL